MTSILINVSANLHFNMAVCFLSLHIIVLLLSFVHLGTAVAPQKQLDPISQIADLKKEFQTKIDYLFKVIQEKDDVHITEMTKLRRQMDILQRECDLHDPGLSMSAKKENDTEIITNTDAKLRPDVMDRRHKRLPRSTISRHTVRERPERQPSVTLSRDRRPSLSARVDHISRTFVAFYSILSPSLSNLGVNQAMIFNHVVTNLGNSFDGITGRFQCKMAGAYVFNVHLLVTPGKYFNALLVKNGSTVGYVYAGGQSGTYDHGGNTIILELNEGDAVWVQNSQDVQQGATLDSGYTSFSGFLLYPY
ncbi:uncharacterized protein [Argopecten irradians]|uniref:uncharacterized protein n=1 Tax=Argopecten irradians TaxID=31199 RepID=UPI003710AC43